MRLDGDVKISDASKDGTKVQPTDVTIKSPTKPWDSTPKDSGPIIEKGPWEDRIPDKDNDRVVHSRPPWELTSEDSGPIIEKGSWQDRIPDKDDDLVVPPKPPWDLTPEDIESEEAMPLGHSEVLSADEEILNKEQGDDSVVYKQHNNDELLSKLDDSPESEKQYVEKNSNLPDQDNPNGKGNDTKETDKDNTKEKNTNQKTEIGNQNDAENNSDLAEKTVEYKGLPKSNGSWDGVPGDSNWIPDRDTIPKDKNGFTNPDGKTWGEILDERGIKGIPFKNGEPDFSILSKGTVEIKDFKVGGDKNADRAKNFAQGNKELANQRGNDCTPADVKKWMKDNKYTWHEKADCKTMEKVPADVHGNISHEGAHAKNNNNEEV